MTPPRGLRVSLCEFNTSFIPEMAKATTHVGCAAAGVLMADSGIIWTLPFSAKGIALWC
jgi:hypothetical protein